MVFNLSGIAYTMFMILAIGAVGYVIGSISIKGVSLGTVGIFVAALAFGHFGVSIPTEVTNFGLILFIAAVGLSAGPTFISGLKQSGAKYALLCISTILAGALVCSLIVKLLGIDPALSVGMMAGAYTTTPGMSAAKEAVVSSANAVTYVATGYGIVYPIAALLKVLYVQVIPKVLKLDMAHERSLIAFQRKPLSEEAIASLARLIKFDPMGFFALSVAAIVGLMVGAVQFPLPGGNTKFALGITGGPLLVSLLMGHFGRIGPISLEIDHGMANPIKEIGLYMFYAGVGTQGGHGIAKIIATYGISLVFIGVLLIIIPLILGTFIGTKILKIPILNCLSCNAASMTFTPAMAALAQKSECDDVAGAYASTYPLALACLVLTCQLLVTFL